MIKEAIKSNIFLVIAIFLVLGVAAVRAAYSLKTGFLVPDEAYYVNTLYGYYSASRPMFTFILWVYISIVGASLFSLLALGPFFGAISSCISLATIWKIGEMFTEKKGVAGLAALSVAITPVFLVMSPTFLTEPVSLALAFLGMFFALRFCKNLSPMQALLSGVAFICAGLIRENYWVFLPGNAFLFGLLAVKLPQKKKFFAAFLIFLVLSIFGVSPRIADIFGLPKHYYFVCDIIPRLNLPGASFDKVPQAIVRPLESDALNQPLSIARALYLFGFGMFSGYSPVLLLLASLGLFLLFKSLRKSKDSAELFLCFNAVLAISVFMLQCFLNSRYLYIHSSTVFRFAHIALPSSVCVVKFYSIVSAKKRIIALTLVIISLCAMAPLVASTVQTHFPTANRLSFDYVSPYFKAYKMLESSNGSALLFAEPPHAVSVFVAKIPGVKLYGFKNATVFETLLKETPAGVVFIYGEIYPGHFELLNASRPFFFSLIRNETSYEVSKVWWDGESYMLEVQP